MVALGLEVHIGFLNGFNSFSKFRITASLKTSSFSPDSPHLQTTSALKSKYGHCESKHVFPGLSAPAFPANLWGTPS